MIETAQDSTLSLLAINGDADDAVYAPSLSELLERLEAVRSGRVNSQCVECVVRVCGDVDGELAFIRVDHPSSGEFGGWIVQLNSSEEYNSFALAFVGEHASSTMETTRTVEFFSCVDTFDARCILSHEYLLLWVGDELSSKVTSDRFRWIDFSIALKEYF